MRFNWKHLQGEEREVFMRMREKYGGYDKVDFLIHKTLKSLGVSLEDFRKRGKKSKNYENLCCPNESSPQTINIASEVSTE